MLFNGSQFWLFASYDAHPLKLVRGTWGAPGSAQLVRRFFSDHAPPPPLLLPLLLQLLSALRLCPTQIDGSAFLGAGGSGRVFAVQSTEPATRRAQRTALKIVPAATRDMWLFDLTHEFKAMRDAAALGAPVVPVVADSLRLLEGVGGGYLLAHCGVPFDATASMAACTAACRLWRSRRTACLGSASRRRAAAELAAGRWTCGMGGPVCGARACWA